jgi:hypothetical protein
MPTKMQPFKGAGTYKTGSMTDPVGNLAQRMIFETGWAGGGLTRILKITRADSGRNKNPTQRSCLD